MQPSINGLEKLTLARYRFYLEAQQPSRLSAYKGSMLRGAAMYAFKRLFCERPEGQICQSRCATPHTCKHGQIFETPAPEDSFLLSNERHGPRPYVIWDRNDRWRDYQPGGTFSFELTLMGAADKALPAFALAIQRAGADGFGRPGRWRLAKITGLSPLDDAETPVFDGQFLAVDRQMFAFDYQQAQRWADHISDAGSLQLRYLSPTRLTFRKEWVQEPEFHILMRTLLRRLSLLGEAHGVGPLSSDLARSLIRKSTQVKLVHDEVQVVSWDRHSKGRGAMTLMGVTGNAWYQGEDLASFLPYLWLGQFIHVGKACVFGNGRYQIVQPSSRSRDGRL